MIEIKNLSKNFGELHAVNDVSVNIDNGEIIAVIGPSGSGKSTFIRCINMLENYDGGQILYKGTDIKQLDINKYRQEVGMVFQHFNLFNNLTILDNITLAPIDKRKQQVKELTKQLKSQKKQGIDISEQLKSLPTKKQIVQEEQENALQLLTRIGLADKANSYPSQLSGGQKQRVAIVRALAMKPEILLFDEPTSALDIEMVQEVLSLIKQLAETKMTMVIVTHELKFAKNVATRVLFMDGGKVVEDNTPDQLFNNPQHSRLKEFFAKTSDLL